MYKRTSSDRSVGSVLFITPEYAGRPMHFAEMPDTLVPAWRGERMNDTARTPTEGRITVLIVDDVAHVREGLRTVLELIEDMEVVGEAENGTEALQMAEQLKPDIVVMDLEMPDLDGFGATRRIKNRRLAKGVVVLTIHDHNHIQERASSVGADAFVEKGAGFQTLVEAIRQVWGQTRAGRRKNGNDF
jgi:YesN/AraC family two-component response regulator